MWLNHRVERFSKTNLALHSKLIRTVNLRYVGRSRQIGYRWNSAVDDDIGAALA
jgi:hypothetical protein